MKREGKKKKGSISSSPDRLNTRHMNWSGYQLSKGTRVPVRDNVELPAEQDK